MRHISSLRLYLLMAVTIALLLALGGETPAAGKPTNTARVSKDSQSITSGVLTDANFDTENYDVGGLHSLSVDPECLTVPLRGDGVYAISASVSWGSGTTGFRFIELLVNDGVDVIAVNLVQPPFSGAPAQNIATQFLLHAGDCVTLAVEHTQGSGISVDADLEMTWIAPG